MDSGRERFANNIEVLKAALVGERGERIIEAARAARAEAELAVARAKASDDQALIAHQQLRIEKLTRQLYGPRSERTSRVLDQIELRFEELESSATEDEIAAEMAVAKTTTVAAFTRKRPARKPLPEHLPRERVIVPGPTTCLCCGGKRLRKLGETVTETLESIPRQWKVIQHVREKFTCRDCEKISQAPAPFHVIARGWAGPSLLAMILFEKFGQHQPLNRQAERYAKEGVPLSLSTLADQVGAGCAVLEPILRRIEAHVFAAERLHGDDTTVPVLAKGKTDTGRCWVYVRDDRSFGGTAPPAAMFYYSRDRAGEHPQAHLANYAGIFQADAYSGYNTGGLFKRASVRRPDLVCHHKRLHHHIRRRNARRGCGLATRTLDRHVLRRRLPARLRRRRGWRPGLHRVRYRVPQANHRRQKGGRRSAAADPIDEIELLRCSPHADHFTGTHATT